MAPHFQIGTAQAASSSFSNAVADRLVHAGDHAAGQFAKVPASVRQRAHQQLRAARQAPTSGKRVFWLQRAAETLAEGYGPGSACGAGCDACCHIPVSISQVEAGVIGRVIGRAVTPPGAHAQQPPLGTACTFLVGGRCAIYVHRPAVCRTHLNLDRDNLLCQLVEDGSIPVPYLDATDVVFASVEIARSVPWADVRQWFPPAGALDCP